MLAALASHRASDADWASSEGWNELLVYASAMSTVCGCLAEQFVLPKRKKVDGGCVVPVLVPAVDLECAPVVTCKTASDLSVIIGVSWTGRV